MVSTIDLLGIILHTRQLSDGYTTDPRTIRKAVNELFESQKPAKDQMMKNVKNEIAETENRTDRPSTST